MLTNRFKPTYLFLLSLVVLSVLSRFLFRNAPNFTPIGGLALFSGLYFAPKKQAYILPLLSLWISNLLLNNTLYSRFYEGFSWGLDASLIFVLIAVGVQVYIGKVTTSLNIKKFIGLNFLSAGVFFVLTNFGVWYFSGMYSLDYIGFQKCFWLALPFFKNTLISQFIFCSFFVGIKLVQDKNYLRIA